VPWDRIEGVVRYPERSVPEVPYKGLAVKIGPFPGPSDQGHASWEGSLREIVGCEHSTRRLGWRSRRDS